MTAVLSNLKLFGPEATLVVFLVMLFLVDGLMPRVRRSITPLFIVGLGCLFGMYVTAQLHVAPSTFFNGMVANDGFAAFFRYVFFFTCGMSLWLSYGSKEVSKDSRMEFAILLLCITFGMSLMAISTNLLMLYLGVETVSIVSFVMAGFKKENLRSNEASFKYLVYGAVASGLMLYGMSLVYGFSGSLYYGEIGRYLGQHSGEMPYVLVVALVLIYGGLAYKVSAFPMHFWTPDVYEGAPTPVATFFSVGPKAAGFAAFLRLFLDVFAVRTGPGTWAAVEGLQLAHGLALVSAATMIVGNLCAIGQSNVKRMLAYSSIAHVGYMLMGLVALNDAGIEAILFYIVAYCAMNLGAFWVVSVVSDLRGNEDVESFRGLGWHMPVLGVTMGVFLFSLTGIPMFSGFIGKFLLFGAVLKAPGFLWLALIGVLNSVVSFYYYAKVLKAMWLDRPLPGEGVLTLSPYHAVPLVALAVPTVMLGLWFSPVLEFARASLATLLH